MVFAGPRRCSRYPGWSLPTTSVLSAASSTPKPLPSSRRIIDTGKVRYVSLRDLPLDFHPNAPGAAVAARCAGEQHKFWRCAT